MQLNKLQKLILSNIQYIIKDNNKIGSIGVKNLIKFNLLFL
jgi:hypothetical protein